MKNLKDKNKINKNFNGLDSHYNQGHTKLTRIKKKLMNS